MKKTILLLTIAAACTAGEAHATDFVFGVSSGDWDVEGNWTPSGGPPVDGDSATIPAGKTCVVDTDEECDSIDVGGTLEIEAAASLTLRPEAGEESDVEGELKLTGDANNTADLIIDGNAQMNGNRGLLLMANGLIKPKNASGDKLTLPFIIDAGTQFLVHGYGEISVALDSAVRVVADQFQKTLKLTGGDKDGTGPAAEWEAFAGGTLEIDCAVTGNARWKQLTGGGATMIVIKHCVSVTGDVSIRTGRFDVQDTFCTSGDLSWTGNTGIDVSSGASVSFGETCSAFCP
jgi:hypothetical protein